MIDIKSGRRTHEKTHCDHDQKAHNSLSSNNKQTMMLVRKMSIATVIVYHHIEGILCYLGPNQFAVTDECFP